jgi:hypothetical protein
MKLVSPNLLIFGINLFPVFVTRDDHLLLCNWSSTDVMVISDDGKHLNDIDLEGRPWGIVVVPHKEEAIVSLPVNTSFFFQL